jgi:hypothetical protein
VENNENQWWGYIHVNGSLHAKRYFGKKDIQEAEESSFVSQIFYPKEGTKEDIIKRMKGSQ